MAKSTSNASGQIQAWSIGLDMAYTMGGGLVLGAIIDWLAGTRPWWMLGLGLFGLVSGMVRFIRDAMRMNRASMKATRRPAPQRPEAEKHGDDRSPER